MAERSAILGAPVGEPGPGGPPGKEIGAQSQQVGGYGGWASFVDEAEYVPDLTWPQSITSFHRMRSDSQVEALHLGTVQPIREFRFSIDPNKAPAKVVEQAAADLGLPILGHEDDPIERSRSTFDFDQFLSDALLAPLYGHFHFEIVGGDEEGNWRMDKLSPRHPRTLAEFAQATTGELTAIRQNIGGAGVGGWSKMPPPIPASKLIPFVWRPEAGSHIGRSMLRSIYREWLIKDRVIRIAAINLERAGGVPVIEGAPGSSDEQLRDLAELARQFKVAEGGGGAIPFGSKLTLVGGNVPDAIALLKYCDECMARVWALMLIQLGVTSGANRALGGEFAVYAARFQRSMAKWVKAQMDRFLDNYVEWNDSFSNYAPLLHFEQSKPDALSVTDLVAMVEAGLITADPELQAWLRNDYNMPEAPKPQTDPNLGDLSPEEVTLVENARSAPQLPAAPTKPSPALDPTSVDPTVASGRYWRRWRGITAALQLPDRKLHREPTENEIRAAVDFRALDRAHADVYAGLHDEFMASVLPKQIAALGDAIRTTKDGTPRTTLTKTAMAKIEAPLEGVDLLKSSLTEAARTGTSAAQSEMEAQGVAHDAPTTEALAARVSDQATAVAELAANGISLAAQRKASSLISDGGRTPDQVAKAVEDHLSGMKHAWTREQLKGAVTMAQNQGRIAAFVEAKVEEEPTYEASELLDDRTCDPCDAVDGKVYANLEEASEDYAAGGYVECEGGPACRGTLIAVFPEQNTMGGEGTLAEPEPAYSQVGA